jgi:Flp pilus assembly protein TadG
VEFALLVPILVVILFAIISVGSALRRRALPA